MTEVIGNLKEAEDKIPGIDQNEPVSEKTTYYVCLFQGTSDDFTTIDWPIYKNLRDKVDTIITTAPQDTIIDLWLDSPGGSAHVAFKIMLLLRSRCSYLRVVVPDFAKSAATLMVIGADERIMPLHAELGPLDVQMQHPDREEEYVSAIDIVRSLEKISSDAINLVISGGAEVLRYTHSKRQETLSAMLQFAAEFMKPIVGKLDATMIHRAYNELQVAKQYAKRLIDMRVEKDIPPIKIEGLVNNFTDDYPSHGFVICPKELDRIGLKTLSMDNYEMGNIVKEMLVMSDKSTKSLVEIFKKEDLQSIFNPGVNNEAPGK